MRRNLTLLVLAAAMAAAGATAAGPAVVIHWLPDRTVQGGGSSLIVAAPANSTCSASIRYSHGAVQMLGRGRKAHDGYANDLGWTFGIPRAAALGRAAVTVTCNGGRGVTGHVTIVPAGGSVTVTESGFTEYPDGTVSLGFVLKNTAWTWKLVDVIAKVYDASGLLVFNDAGAGAYVPPRGTAYAGASTATSVQPGQQPIVGGTMTTSVTRVIDASGTEPLFSLTNTGISADPSTGLVVVKGRVSVARDSDSSVGDVEAVFFDSGGRVVGGGQVSVKAGGKGSVPLGQSASFELRAPLPASSVASVKFSTV